MQYLFLIIFVLAAAVHLHASRTCNDKLRARSKFFLALMVLCYFCCSAYTHGSLAAAGECSAWMPLSPALVPQAFAFAFQTHALFCFALLFAWIGDWFLTHKGFVWFSIGGFTFGGAHILLVIYLALNTNFCTGLWGIGIIACFAYLVPTAFALNRMYGFLNTKLRVFATTYIGINAIMNCMAFFHLLSAPGIGSLIIVFGALCFLVSDCILVHVRFNKETTIKTHTSVMATYIMALFFLAQGVILCI